MADIKFMNLSQNDNPASTDSVLIGNAEGGLKRTTLGRLGDLFSVKGLMHFEKVTYNSLGSLIPSSAKDGDALGLKCDVQAPTVPGYTFACWIGSSTFGFQGSVYMTNQDNSSAQVWVNATKSQVTGDGKAVNAMAMYIKSEVA